MHKENFRNRPLENLTSNTNRAWILLKFFRTLVLTEPWKNKILEIDPNLTPKRCVEPAIKLHFDTSMTKNRIIQQGALAIESSEWFMQSPEVRQKVALSQNPGKLEILCSAFFFLNSHKRLSFSGAARISVRGETLGSRPSKGSGGGRSPPDAVEFSKICKQFLKKIAKMHYISVVLKILSKPCVNFSRVWTKNEVVEEHLINFENFW